MGRLTRIPLLLLLLILLLTACGRSNINAPTATSVLFVPSKTPVEPTATPDPAQVAAQGETLFTTFYDDAGFACATCHHVDSEERLVGPGLLDIGQRAATREDGIEAEDYIRKSILNPSATVVDDYADNLMPSIYADIFTEAELNAIIAYLLTL
jgi:cytochrome c2